MKYRTLFRTYLLPQKGSLFLLFLLLLSSIGFQLVNPQVIKTFIDSAQAGQPLKLLIWTALLFLAIAFGQQVITVLSTYLGERVGWRATNRLRLDVLAHTLHLDLSFHNKKTPGEMIERIDGDVSALANMFSKFLFQVLGSFLLLIGVLVALWQVDWRSSAAFAVFTLLVVVVLNAVRSVVVPHWLALSQAQADYFGFLEERLQGTEDVRANGGVSYVLHRFTQAFRHLIAKERKAMQMNSLSWSTTSGLFLIGNAVALSIGYFLFDHGGITIGTVYMISFYTEMLRRPIENIASQFTDLQKASAALKRISELLDTRSRIVDGRGIAIPAGTPALEMERVSFGYDEEEMILHDISLHLQPGRILGLLGRTGSGKSTLGRLVFRLYDPTVGIVRLSGIDLRDTRLSELRSRIGMVTQDVQLFHATIRDNLTFFTETIEDEQIFAALRDIGLSEWIDALPNGLDTMLDADGGGLS
ncbi:MAG TPA: ABC transporter ATP-binding protein, partial [Bacilli bacterium]|nr:ABC transporter ATP-binding protein [Bacilli bacterium]